MKTSTFSDRLNICLDKEGFPPKNCGRIQLLAEMVGLTHRGASKWVNGQSKPPAAKFASLAQKLNVDETWLKSGEGSMQRQNTNNMASNNNEIVQDVAIYSASQLLTLNKEPKKVIKCNLPHDGDFFGVLLETEAMSPRFPQGSIIIFDSKPTVKDGDFVLVNMADFPAPIFRQLFIIESIMYLNAHNPKFDRLICQKNNQILGKLILAILAFD